MPPREKKTRTSRILAQEIMTKDVCVIDKNSPVSQVACLMLKRRIHGYPIVNDKKRWWGLSLQLIYLFWLTVWSIGRMGALNKKLTVVKWGIHTFPVMKENKLVGIIGRHDIINALFL